MIEPWDEEPSVEYLEENKHDNGMKVDILKSNIYWHRNDRLIKLNKIKRTTDESKST